MSTAMQKRLVQVGIGYQNDFGYPAPQAQFRFGVQDGSAVKTDVDEADLDTTWSTRLPEGFERTQVRSGMEYGFVAIKQLIGQHLFHALGADVVSGGGPYTHTITEAEPLPYATGFGREGSEYLQVQDMLLNTLELSFEKTSALKAKAAWLGTDIQVLGGAWPSGADERVQSGYFNMGGGAFTIDGASANIQKGTIKIDNHLVPIAAAFQVEPVDYMPGMLTLEYSFTIIPNDLGLWAKIIFGDRTHTTGVSPIPVYCNIHQEWLSGSDTLTMDAPQAKCMVGFPAASPEGGPVELEVEGKTAVYLSGQAIQFALLNQTASYAPANPATTVAAGSDGAMLPQGTIHVASSSGFPSAGHLNIATVGGPDVVAYTGVGVGTFTGCTGGGHAMATGEAVTLL